MKTGYRSACVLVVAALLALVPSRSASQEDSPSQQTVITAAGPQYGAGAVHRWMLGAHYRNLWVTPIRVEVLDLQSMAGGLTPIRIGGGMQTRSLRFLGADGREYLFRSVDKDPSPILDPILLETMVQDVLQDAISAAHPFGALVAAPLLDAVGILHVDPRLRVMPDDPSLGEFRGEFAGILGLVEERPDENEGDRTAFRGTSRVVGSERLMELIDAGPGDRVNARAFLEARLVDVFLGDWDRHRGQWRWATFASGEERTWLPVPRDRDYAFAKFDGLLPRIAGFYVEQFVRFGEEYPSIARLHWNARDIDRRFLAELDRTAWDSVGASIQTRLTDEVIEQAVRQLPPEIHAINGQALGDALRARRDELPDAWAEFYGILSDKVDVHATHANEIATVDRTEGGALLVTVTAPDVSERPYFSRYFEPGETREVRLYLRGGDDSVVVRGDAEAAILVRVIGGQGDDRFEVVGAGTGLRLYDAEGANEVFGREAPSLNEQAFDEWEWTEDDKDEPLDWGGWTYPVFWSSFSSDLGLFVGGGARVQRHGFRKTPYASSFDIRGGYAPSIAKGRFEFAGRMHSENSPRFWTVGARVSRLDVLHYYGLGNESATGPQTFHEVDLTSASGSLGLGIAPSASLDFSLAATIERSSTRPGTGRYFGTLGEVYGGGSFVELGLGAQVTFDPWSHAKDTGNRLRVRLHGDVTPAAFDVARTFGRVGGEVSVLMASSPWPRLAVNLRAGAQDVMGRFPWYAAAFIGGSSTVRGLDEQRYAGDAATWTSGEVRLRAWTPRFVVPIAVGIFGFSDMGRVWSDGASPGGWHRTAGGGVYLQPFGQPYIVRLAAGWGEDATKVFVGLGLPY